MKFLLENNLSKLAKWLRFLGYEVKVLEGPVNLRDLIANRERVFITTSRRWERTLRNLGMRFLVVPRQDWELQICTVLKELGIEPVLKLNRCAYCGGDLKPVNKEDFKERIPPKAYEAAYDFTYCQSATPSSGRGFIMRTC
ncbi:MAG: Mut7-C RNAse domain-containing protein [Aquificota bacterium]|nr:Mut7-C RNAse domain-containing protein [Aquificota bacterium]